MLTLILDGEIIKDLYPLLFFPPNFHVFSNVHLLCRNDQELLFRKNNYKLVKRKIIFQKA